MDILDHAGDRGVPWPAFARIVRRPAEDGGAGARADGRDALLLLDEPFEGLAPALARRLGEVMASLKGQGLSILIAESNEGQVADLLSRAFRIERGAVTAV